MKGYLAIIKDCFWEARASASLRGMLIMLTLFLILVAPIGLTQRLTTGLAERDIYDGPALIDLVKEQGRSPKPTPGKRIWLLMGPQMQERLGDYGKQRVKGDMTEILIMAEFYDNLNRLLRRRDFYEAQAYRHVRLRPEAQQLLKTELDNLSDEQVKRLNRVALESAFRGMVRISEPASIAVTYLVWDTGEWFPLSRQQFRSVAKRVIRGAMNYVFGPLGVLIAILFTAPIIPRMFDEGSLNLLLSKPISRSLLLLAKFTGGCAFILIYVAYLIVGIWLILGLRLGIWSHRLLLIAPIYLFIFAIYYSVSALAAVVWKNTIVCIVSCVLFWALCFGLGATKSAMEESLKNQRIVHIVPAGQALLMVNQSKEPHLWDASRENWAECFLTVEQQEMGSFMRRAFLGDLPLWGPIYDARRDRLIAVQGSFRSRRNYVHVGYQTDQWKNQRGLQAPSGLIDLLQDARGDSLLITAGGIMKLQGDPLAKQDASSKASLPLPIDLDWLPEIPFWPAWDRGVLMRVDDPSTWPELQRPWSAAINRRNGHVAVQSGGSLMVFRLEEEKYVLSARADLDVAEGDVAVRLAFAGNSILAASDQAEIVEMDSKSLGVRRRSSLPRGATVRSLRAAADGREFALVLGNGELWTLDAESGRLIRPDYQGQGEISAVEYAGSGRLFVADRETRITEYERGQNTPARTFAPSLTVLEQGYRYGVRPLHFLFPKPSELNETIAYVLRDGEGAASSQISATPEELHPWAPVWSSLAFMVISLTLACVHFERQEC